MSDGSASRGTDDTKSTDGTGSSRTPQELRTDVERTREELGRTVEELAARADVPARARQKASVAKERTREQAARLSLAVRDGAAGRAALTVRDNRYPLLAAAGAGAVLVTVVVAARSRQSGNRNRKAGLAPGLSLAPAQKRSPAQKHDRCRCQWRR